MPPFLSNRSGYMTANGTVWSGRRGVSAIIVNSPRFVLLPLVAAMVEDELTILLFLICPRRRVESCLPTMASVV